MEIWGWGKREEVEKLQKRYLIWLLGVTRRVPGYMVREELRSDKMAVRAGMKAWGYDKKIDEEKRGELAWRYQLEMRKRVNAGKGIEGWENERLLRENREGFSRSREEMGDERNERGKDNGSR